MIATVSILSVRPPKKSWKNISNLSGGEKTLSSLALVGLRFAYMDPLHKTVAWYKNTSLEKKNNAVGSWNELGYWLFSNDVFSLLFCLTARLSISLIFFLVGYAILKDFIIHRSKIPAVTSGQLTNRTVKDISRGSGHSICQSFFSRVNLLWFKSIQAKQVDLQISSVGARPHALKLASITSKNLWKVDL